MPWIKIWTEILDDHKLGRLPSAAKWHFVAICVLAGECDAKGYLVNGAAEMTLSDIAWRLREDPEELTASVDALQSAGFLSQDDTGTWYVNNFAKRQGRPQYQKRAEWRERKRRNDEPEDSNKIVVDAEIEPEKVHAGITRESNEIPALREREEKEKEIEKILPAVAGADPIPPPGERDKGLSEGQRFWLDSFGAKRFANTVQRQAVLALERNHGTKKFKEGIDWAAKQGMGMGKALTSLETALPNWDKKKGQRNGAGQPNSRQNDSGVDDAPGYTVQGWIHRGATAEEFYGAT